MPGEGNDSLDRRVPIDVMTGATTRQIPSVLFQLASDPVRFSFHYRFSFAHIYAPFHGNISSRFAQKIGLRATHGRIRVTVWLEFAAKIILKDWQGGCDVYPVLWWLRVWRDSV